MRGIYKECDCSYGTPPEFLPISILPDSPGLHPGVTNVKPLRG